MVQMELEYEQKQHLQAQGGTSACAELGQKWKIHIQKVNILHGILFQSPRFFMELGKSAG